MSERAPGKVTSLVPGEESLGSRWMRFALPPAATTRLRLRHIAGECGAWTAIIAVLLVLLTPTAGFIVAGSWALTTYIRTLIVLWQHVKSYQLTSLAPQLDSLNLAARVGLASAGYFTLLAALIVLMAGLLGRHWRRLFLFPGIILTLPGALAFFWGMRLSLTALATPRGISSLAQTALLAYLLMDVIVLAAALVDVSPRRRRRVRSQRQRTPSAPLVPVHFGPSGPLAATRKLAESAHLEPPVPGVVPEKLTSVAAIAPVVEDCGDGKRALALTARSEPSPLLPAPTEDTSGEGADAEKTSSPLAQVG